MLSFHACFITINNAAIALQPGDSLHSYSALLLSLLIWRPHTLCFISQIFSESLGSGTAAGLSSSPRSQPLETEEPCPSPPLAGASSSSPFSQVLCPSFPENIQHGWKVCYLPESSEVWAAHVYPPWVSQGLVWSGNQMMFVGQQKGEQMGRREARGKG